GARGVGASSHGPSSQAWRALAGTDGRRGVRRRGMIAAFGVLIAGINRAGLGPVRADISGTELRRAGLRAFGEVLARLGVRVPHVVFGHTHRAGPLPTDDRSEWRAPTGSSVVNCGSWVHEPEFLGRSPQRSPYRPGFAVRVAGEGPPELVNLLDPAPPPPA